MFNSLDYNMKQLNRQVSILSNRANSLENQLNQIDRYHKVLGGEIQRFNQTIEIQDNEISQIKTYCICICLLLVFIVVALLCQIEPCATIKEKFTKNHEVYINSDSSASDNLEKEVAVKIPINIKETFEELKMVNTPIMKTTKNVDVGIVGFTEQITKKKKKKKVKFMTKNKFHILRNDY